MSAAAGAGWKGQRGPSLHYQWARSWQNAVVSATAIDPAAVSFRIANQQYWQYDSRVVGRLYQIAVLGSLVTTHNQYERSYTQRWPQSPKARPGEIASWARPCFPL